MIGPTRYRAWPRLLSAAPAPLPAAAMPAAAQVGSPPPPAVAVAPRTGGTLVAVSVVIPGGSAEDPDALPGASRLVAETVARGVRSRLESEAARIEVRVERSATVFTLLSAPEVWIHAWSVLEDALFRDPLLGDALEAAKSDLIASAVFQDGAPVREFERELYQMLGGAASPWSRDPQGMPSSLERASLTALETFRASYYRPGPATVAIVGPVNEGEARRAVAPVGEDPAPALHSGSAAAWEDGDRRALGRDVTNSWIGAAFPAPRDFPRTQLAFLAQQMEERLNPSPPDAGLFGASVAIEDTPRGPLLVVEAAVVSEAAGEWEHRILAAVEELKKEPLDGFFRLQRRRFRNAMLLRESAPEEAALRMARDLLRDGRVRALEDEVWAIGAPDLARAAGALGTPRLLVMGPDVAAARD